MGSPLTLGKAPGKASFPPSLPCVQAAAANFWQGLLYSTLQARLGTAKQPSLGEKLLELAGWQLPRPWPQAQRSIGLPHDVHSLACWQRYIQIGTQDSLANQMNPTLPGTIRSSQGGCKQPLRPKRGRDTEKPWSVI